MHVRNSRDNEGFSWRTGIRFARKCSPLAPLDYYIADAATTKKTRRKDTHNSTVHIWQVAAPRRCLPAPGPNRHRTSSGVSGACQVHVFNLTSINESAPWRSRSQFPARVIHLYPQEHLTSVQLFSICFLFRHGTFRAHECFKYNAGAAITLLKHDNGEKAAMPTKPVIASMNAARQSRGETLPWLGKARKE